MITDKGSQFYCTRTRKPSAALQGWLDRTRTKVRFGAVGRKGSIAIIERWFGTLKREGMRLMFVPYDDDWIHAELDVFTEWYNTMRPHSSLMKRTPSEVHAGIAPPSHQPRYEVRPRYPVSEEDVECGNVWRANVVRLDAKGFKRRKHLPDVSLDVAA